MPERMHSIALLVPLMALGQGCSLFHLTPKRPATLDAVHRYGENDLKRDLDAYRAPGDDVTRKAIRNRVVIQVAVAVDADYESFANRFFVEQGWVDTALDVAIIGVGSAGALTGGEAFKAIMSATSAGISGSRASFGKNFFKEKSPEIVRARMGALRAKQWAVIYQKLASPDSQYTLYEAERDLIVYYNAGTVRAAFDDIVAESGSEAKKAEAKLTAELKKRFGPSLEEPEDAVAWELLATRLRSVQHGQVEIEGRTVTVDRDAIACRVLQRFDATQTCDDALSKLSLLVRNGTDRETTRKVNEAFVNVFATLR